jgi:hypothetical protein
MASERDALREEERREQELEEMRRDNDMYHSTSSAEQTVIWC